MEKTQTHKKQEFQILALSLRLILLPIFLQLQLFIFNANFLTFHFVSINHIKGSENTFNLLVFSASKDLSAVSLPTEDPPII